ncbi:hypothetical protein EHQ53_08235 [Leptospira langatensis]|uniref:Uncharacterized protein n=1 Tax=Leptospira langatensis TaxID=2484983 RepID=A0A5F1ZVG0_9LEPT|nr:hypothetical protein [Leptospira langatensis]TGK01376.1 hypothetical protein EHO57_10635 [Leptospira langatensis]TGL42443.1 hypothetical protein EHQ53_08235 [Leptospira langatensis]
MKLLPNLNLRSKAVFCVFLAFAGFNNCKQTPKEKVRAVLSDASMSEEEKIKAVALTLFGERLKEIEITSNQDEQGSKYDIYMGFGGTSALTFLESSQYAIRMKVELALETYRFLQALNEIRFGKYRMSLIKPFFIKNGATRGIEEFEIFRFRTNAEEIKAISGFNETDSFDADRFDSPSAPVMIVLNEMMKLWQIELDQFARVEVK